MKRVVRFVDGPKLSFSLALRRSGPTLLEGTAHGGNFAKLAGAIAAVANVTKWQTYTDANGTSRRPVKLGLAIKKNPKQSYACSGFRSCGFT